MRAVHALAFLALALPLAACENGPPWAGGGGQPDAEAPPDFGPTAAYNRRLLFLGPGEALPTSAVFDFVALSDSIGIRRGIRARVVDGAGWRSLVDVGWEMEPMREPWRLVPHGSLKMVVGESGDLSELIHRDSLTTRLRLGTTLAELSPDVGTQLVLRGARLAVDDASVPGILLDAQLGRAVNPGLVTRDADAADAGTDADSALDGSASPTPIARPGSEALLLDNSGYYAVMAGASGGSLAWIRNAGRDDVRNGTRLEPTAWTPAEAGGVQVPTAWRIVSPDGAVTGELTARSTDRIVLDGGAGLDALAYVVVTGWIEDRTVRRDIFGLVRHVR